VNDPMIASLAAVLYALTRFDPNLFCGHAAPINFGSRLRALQCQITTAL
jgi:hypothetical protein